MHVQNGINSGPATDYRRSEPLTELDRHYWLFCVCANVSFYLWLPTRQSRRDTNQITAWYFCRTAWNEFYRDVSTGGLRKTSYLNFGSFFHYVHTNHLKKMQHYLAMSIKSLSINFSLSCFCIDYFFVHKVDTGQMDIPSFRHDHYHAQIKTPHVRFLIKCQCARSGKKEKPCDI